MRLYRGLLLLMLLSGLAGQVYASAWTVEPGTGKMIATASFYAADHYYDTNGHKRTQPSYSQQTLNPYFEYGLRDDLTVGGSVFLQRAHQLRDTNWGIGDSEFFLRKRLWQQGGFSLALEPLVKLPSLSASSGDTPLLGNRHGDFALGLSAGYGWRGHYVDVGAQYRHRLGAPRDQVRFSATGGIALSEKWTLMPQAFLTLRTGHAAGAPFTESAGDDYTQLRLQLSALYRLDDSASVQFGAFDDAAARNTGYGSGVLVAWWKRF